jgi:hypothetical protein
MAATDNTMNGNITQGGTALHASSSAGLSTMVEQLVNGTFGKTADVHVSEQMSTSAS